MNCPRNIASKLCHLLPEYDQVSSLYTNNKHSSQLAVLSNAYDTIKHLSNDPSTGSMESIDRALFLVSSLKDRLYEIINIGWWSEVDEKVCKTFTIVTFLEAVFRLHQPSDKCSFEKLLYDLDLGLMLGYPLSGTSNVILTESIRIIEENGGSNCQAKKAKLSAPDVSMGVRRSEAEVKHSSIGVLKRPSVEHFLINHFMKQVPVLIQDCMDHWPAMTKWKKSDYLSSIAGERTIPFEIGANYMSENWSQDLVKFKDFLNRQITRKEACDRIEYLAQHNLFDQIPALRKDIIVPEYCCVGSSNESVDIKAWLGPKGTTSPMHYDPKHNLLCQVFGHKKIILAAPDDTPNLYPHETEMLKNTSQIDAELINATKYPLCAKVQNGVRTFSRGVLNVQSPHCKQLYRMFIKQAIAKKLVSPKLRQSPSEQMPSPTPSHDKKRMNKRKLNFTDERMGKIKRLSLNDTDPMSSNCNNSVRSPNLYNNSRLSPNLYNNSVRSPNLYNNSRLSPNLYNNSRLSPNLYNNSRLSPNLYNNSTLSPNLDKNWRRTPKLNKNSTRKSSTGNGSIWNSKAEPQPNYEILLNLTPDVGSIEEGRRLFDILIRPLTVDRFMEQNWQKQPMRLDRKCPNFYQDLLSTGAIDQMLRQSHVEFTKNIEVQCKEGEEVVIPTGRALPPTIWQYYNDGSTIKLLNPQNFLPTIHSMSSTLQEYFQCMIDSTVYLGSQCSEGQAPRYDDVEMFILQIEGQRHWRIYEPTHGGQILSREGGNVELETELLDVSVLDVVLKSGDLMYFPRGYIHEATTKADSHWMYLTLSIYRQQTYGDLLEILMPMALKEAITDNVSLRKGLPLNIWHNMGVVNSDNLFNERDTVISKIRDCLVTVGRHVRSDNTLDDAVDQMALRYQHDALPPKLTPEEKRRTVYGTVQFLY